MVATTLKEGTNTELRGLLESAIGTIGETLSSVVGREIQVQPGEMAVQDADSLLGSLPRTCAVARGAMRDSFAGKSMLTIIELPDAVSMSGLLMMTPADVISKRRESGAFEGEDVEAFGELGNVIYSGFSTVLREQLKNFDISMQDHGMLQVGADEAAMLGGENLVTFSFRLKVGENPQSQGMIAIDIDTAEKWNKNPIEADGPVTAGGGAESKTPTQRIDDEGLESIPAAPIRGVLASFVIQPEVYRMLRRSCRRVGLEVRRHGRGEIPNPAAHRNQIVLLDVPPAEDRRFDWCRRIKDLSATTKVVVMLHHASRQRVTQAFLSCADAILGLPCAEQELTQKLKQLLEELQPQDKPEPEGEE